MPMSPEQVADLALRAGRLQRRAEAAEARVRDLEEQLRRAGIEWLEAPVVVVAGPYSPGGDDVPVQTGMEVAG